MVCLNPWPSVCLPACLPVSVPVCLSLCLPACLPVSVPACLRACAALTGSSTCTIIAFIYPAMLYVVAMRNPSYKANSVGAVGVGRGSVPMAYALGLVGSVFGLIATATVLRHGGTSHGR
jgi:hypothetical protein